MRKVNVGKVVNTHGIKGEIRILSNFKYKSLVFQKGNHLYIDEDNYLIMLSKKFGVKVVTDLELFHKYSLSKEKIIITGTNGKSTCVELLSKILNAPAIGNIGIPLSSIVKSIKSIQAT